MPQLVVEDQGNVTPSGRLYVSPDAAASGQPTPPSAADAGGQQPATPDTNDPWAAFLSPPASSKGAQSHAPASGGDPWAAFLEKPPAPKVRGTGEAIGRGLMHGASMGLEPAAEGAQAEADADIASVAKKFGLNPDTAVSFLNHVAPGLTAAYGAGKTIGQKLLGNETPAYDKARAAEAEANAEAREQHPYTYGAGDIAGSLAVPLPGLGAVRTGANLGMRAARGAAEGMMAGGAFGAGNAIGEGKDTRGVLGDTATGVLGGSLLGGTMGGAIGARPPAAPTAVDRAARYAESLGAPLPRGVASNSPMVRAATAKLKEVPFAGERIGERVGETQRAVADRVDQMATGLAGGAPTRTTAAPGMPNAINQIVQHNNGEIDNAYNGLRAAINPDQHFPMPALTRALQQIVTRRARAGWQNPQEGLQQAANVAQGVGHAGGFNGVHRLRRDLREAGNPAKANPGYDAGDFRALKRAVDADLRPGVRHVSTNPNHAESLYNTAELTAQHLIQMNEQMERLAGRHGEAIVGALLNSIKEKNGNIQLLREVRQRISPQAFNQISGALLHELGLAEGQVGEFSMARFVTNWNKVSDQAKALMFSPQHRAEIENIVGLGEHLKDAARYTPTSHTGAFVAILELAETARELITHGGLNMATVGAMASSGGTWLATRWLASPTTSASLSKWSSAYRALTLNQPTPARIAAFKVATRNLSHNVGLPVARIMGIASDHLSNGRGNALAAPPDSGQAGVPDKKQHAAVDRPRI